LDGQEFAAGAQAPRDLQRGMKLLGALFLTLSAATPASSVFVIVPDVLSQAGTGALIAMGLAALIAICVAQVYAELGSAFPLAGGEYAMVARTLGALPGFAVLGLNLANSLLATAVLALGVSPYLAAAGIAIPPVPLALAVVLGATLLSVLNIRTNALITGLFVGVELASLVVLAVLGFAHPQRSLPMVLAHPVTLSHGALTAVSPAAIGLAVAVAIFAYDGYGSAVYFSEELTQARKGIGRAIVWALVITVAAEMIPLAGAVLGAPDLKSLLGSDSGLADFIGAVGGPVLRRVISLGIALAIINAVIAMVLLTARQLFATGRDQAWPRAASAALVRIHPRLRSPWVATLAAGALAAGLCFVDLKLLLIATGTGTAVIYGVLCLAVLMGRRTGVTDHGFHRSPFHPWLPLATLAALAGVLYADWIDPDEGRPGLLIAVGVSAAFALYYAIGVRGRGRWRLSEPEDQGDQSGR
jgi:amino acid transporter